jgi:hypothetical protein
MIEDYPKNEDWEYVIPTIDRLEMNWVSRKQTEMFFFDTKLYKYVMHRLRRTWLHKNTKELVDKFIYDYCNEY